MRIKPTYKQMNIFRKQKGNFHLIMVSFFNDNIDLAHINQKYL